MMVTVTPRHKLRDLTSRLLPLHLANSSLVQPLRLVCMKLKLKLHSGRSGGGMQALRQRREACICVSVCETQAGKKAGAERRLCLHVCTCLCLSVSISV